MPTPNNPFTLLSHEHQIIRADLHVHTALSHDGISTSAEVIDAAIKQNLDVVAITDHNETQATFEARDYVASLGSKVLVLPGVEVSTSQGHVLAIGVHESIPKHLSLDETITIIHEKQGIAIPAHPFDFLRIGCGDQIETIKSVIDAVETFNAAIIVPWANRKAQRWAIMNKIPGVGGSDSHTPSTVGRAFTLIQHPKNHSVTETSVLAQIRNGLTTHGGTTTTLLEKLSKEWQRRRKEKLM